MNVEFILIGVNSKMSLYFTGLLPYLVTGSFHTTVTAVPVCWHCSDIQQAQQ